MNYNLIIIIFDYFKLTKFLFEFVINENHDNDDDNNDETDFFLLICLKINIIKSNTCYWKRRFFSFIKCMFSSKIHIVKNYSIEIYLIKLTNSWWFSLYKSKNHCLFYCFRQLNSRIIDDTKKNAKKKTMTKIEIIEIDERFKWRRVHFQLNSQRNWIKYYEIEIRNANVKKSKFEKNA